MPNRATMPDERGSPDWIRLDGRIDEYGLAEDPGKFLDGPLDPHPRIRGLASLNAVAAWRVIERETAEIRNRPPDQDVLDALDARERYLESIDEQPARRDGRAVPAKEVLLNGEPWEAVDRSGALESLQAGPSDPSVAADGGESRDE